MALLSQEQIEQRKNPIGTPVLMLAADRALLRGFAIFGLQPRKKEPLQGSRGFKDAKTAADATALDVWRTAPDANIGIACGESDLCVPGRSTTAVPQWITDTKTYKVRTAKGLHVYFSGARPTKKLYVNGEVVGDIKSTGGYVLAAGSVHPDGPVYTAVDESPVIPTPERIAELYKHPDQLSTEGVSFGSTPIPHGSHDTELTRIAGKLRQIGQEENAIRDAITEICEKRCVNYGSDYKEMCAKIAHSVSRYEPGKDERILFGGKEGGTTVHQPAQPQTQPAPAPEDLPKSEAEKYPAFPLWVMNGTSIYENFVKPVCDVNSRIPYFMWFPAMQIMMNHLSRQVRVEGHDVKSGHYSVIIGKFGCIKSASTEDAIHYMREVGIAGYASTDTQNSNGKTLIWTAGSPEGLGIDMAKTNCKNAVLFYDELKNLVDKAGTDNSAMISALLQMYESGNFANAIKAKKDVYALAPGTYTTSVIAATTDEAFPTLWSKMSGASTGLDDRFVFIYQPEVLPEMTEQLSVNTDMNADRTKAVIDKAVHQGVYSVSDSSPIRRLIKIGNRYGHRAMKYALYFAIGLGRDETDEECIERGIALVDYEIGVKKYLKTYEALTREGGIQQELAGRLKKAGGMMLKKELEDKMHKYRIGTTVYNYAYSGLIKDGVVAEYGTGTKSDPKRVHLLRDIG